MITGGPPIDTSAISTALGSSSPAASSSDSGVLPNVGSVETSSFPPPRAALPASMLGASTSGVDLLGIQVGLSQSSFLNSIASGLIASDKENNLRVAQNI